jgi:hypothetical protein
MPVKTGETHFPRYSGFAEIPVFPSEQYGAIFATWKLSVSFGVEIRPLRPLLSTVLTGDRLFTTSSWKMLNGVQ